MTQFLGGAKTKGAPASRTGRKGICRKCRKRERVRRYAGQRFCDWCFARVIGVMARAGALKGKPLTTQERRFLFQSFLHLDVFLKRKRISRGRIRRLLELSCSVAGDRTGIVTSGSAHKAAT
jgi:hypothetical protein